jgi:hypothetical protein
MKNYSFLLFFILIFISGCSTTVDFHGSTNTFTSPEVVGKTLGLSGQFGFSSSNKFVLSTLEQASIFSSQIVVNNNAGLVKDNNIQTQIGLGLLDNYEFYYRAMGDSPDPIGFKWQIIGDGYEKKSNGYKLLIFAGAAPSYNDKGSLIATNGSGTTRSYNTDLKVSMVEVGSSFGYRMNAHSIVYMTPYYRKYKADAVLTSTTNPTYNINKEPIVRGVNVGASFNTDSNLVLMIEGGYSHSQYSSSQEVDDLAIGGSLGFNILSF